MLSSAQNLCAHQVCMVFSHAGLNISSVLQSSEATIIDNLLWLAIFIVFEYLHVPKLHSIAVVCLAK